MQQMIIVKYVDEYIYEDKGEYNVQFAGISDRKPMKLQVWTIAYDTADEAKRQRELMKVSKLAVVNK